MSTTEDRLRQALHATAALVEPAEREAPAPNRRWRFLLPVAVAVAVSLVITLVTTLTPHRTRDDGPTPVIPPAPSGPAAPSTAAYFVSGVDRGGEEEIAISDARTGRVSDTFRSPADGLWTAASATADPRTFYLSAQADQAHVYRLRIDAHGRVGSLTKVAAVAQGQSDLIALAASPDGKRVAYPVNNPPTSAGAPYGPAEIDVLTVATGHKAVYRTTVSGRVSSLSWAADGRHLAFELDGADSLTTGFMVLDTRAGSDLLSASHLVLTQSASRKRSGYAGRFTAPVLSADGRSLYAIGTVGTGKTRRTMVLEFSVGAGGQERVLYQEPYAGGGAQWSFTLLARDPGGGSLLAVGNGRVRRIALRTRTVTNLPLSRGEPNLVAW
jgi:hypothetical protein